MKRHLGVIGLALTAAIGPWGCRDGGGVASDGTTGGTGDTDGEPEPLQRYCGEATQDVEMRITDLLSQLTVAEKVTMMHGAGLLTVDDVWLVEGHEGLGVPAFHMLDGPRGVSDVAGVEATAFPVAMLRGATWDRALEREVGKAIARETRAAGGDVLLAPTLNILRHPAWGRSQETYGEDVHHLGVMAAAFIEGAQSEGVIATAKHYAVNSIEDTRFDVDVTVDERSLREIYLPHFREAVDAGVGAVMTAYNSVNGKECDRNAHLLTDILRDEWAYAGFVMSDWILGTHSDVESLRAGLDIEMPSGSHFGRLEAAVADGRLGEDELDASLRRNLRARFCFGLDTNPPVRDPEGLGTPEHAGLALHTAHRGIVLLRNEGLLPLDRDSIGRVVVTGPLADVPNIGDAGSSDVEPVYVITALQGLLDRAGSVEIVHIDSDVLTAQDQTTIEQADAVVVVAGLTEQDEGESTVGAGDRDSLALPAGQAELISMVAATGTPTIVVLEGGGALSIADWVGDVQAILMAFYPGIEGGHAIADILFGDIAPSGRLPLSFPISQDDLPPFDHESLAVTYGFLHGYRYLQARQTPPLFEFGHGLSYTTFEYGNLVVDDTQVGVDDTISLRVDVTNAGDRAAIETVQLYVSVPQSEVERAPADLRAFAQVALEPGQTKTVTLSLPVRDLAYYDTTGAAWRVEATDYTLDVGHSSLDVRLSTAITVVE